MCEAPFFDGKRFRSPTVGHWWHLRVIQTLILPLLFSHVSIKGASFSACSLKLCLLVMRVKAVFFF